MSTDLKLHELTGSPNNVKIRIALAYKGLDYERVPLEFESFPGDRTSLVRISRQPRAPVLEHGKTIVYDSSGILRYLDANFPDTPTLFADDYEAFGEIERWELFARTKIGEPIGLIFGQAFAPSADPQTIATANQLLAENTGALEDRLNNNEFLVGDHLTAADIVCAAPLYLTDLTDENAQAHPVAAFFQADLKLGDDRPKTRAWIRRVIAYDPIKGKR